MLAASRVGLGLDGHDAELRGGEEGRGTLEAISGMRPWQAGMMPDHSHSNEAVFEEAEMGRAWASRHVTLWKGRDGRDARTTPPPASLWPFALGRGGGAVGVLGEAEAAARQRAPAAPDVHRQAAPLKIAAQASGIGAARGAAALRLVHGR